jgi:hypothetical protein
MSTDLSKESFFEIGLAPMYETASDTHLPRGLNKVADLKDDQPQQTISIPKHEHVHGVNGGKFQNMRRILSAMISIPTCDAAEIYGDGSRGAK